MNKIFFNLGLISLSSAQDILQTAKITQNKNGILAVDYYKNGSFVYYSGGVEYVCALNVFGPNKCAKYTVKYTPNTYVITKSHLLVNDGEQNSTCRYPIVPGSGLCYIFVANKYISQKNSISVLDPYFYVRRPEDSAISIFNYTRWGLPNSNIPLKVLSNQDSPWFVMNDGLYSFRTNDTKTTVIT